MEKRLSAYSFTAMMRQIFSIHSGNEEDTRKERAASCHWRSIVSE
jgi:hypothetical protein